jgi:glycosyltransferase involved in cell wall biosynthesis
LPINLGIGGGMQIGYKYALNHDYDIAVQFDADGQHNESDLKALLFPIINGQADMVVGSRFVKKNRLQRKFV